MPNKKLDKKKLAGYKKLLLTHKENLLHDIRTMSEEANSKATDSGDISGHVQHMADVASDIYDKEFSLGLASKDREILQLIDAALKRIDDGSYGMCFTCKVPITQARLKAIPYAEYCLKHQEEIDRRIRR